MQTLRKRWLPLLIAALVIGGPVAWYKWPSTASAAEAALTAPVKQGDFKVLVTTTGELRARKFVQIQGPNSQAAQVYQTKITSIVPEGTVVKEGDEDRRARSRAGGDATRDGDARQPEGAGGVHERLAGLDAEPGAVAREDVRTAEYTLEEKKLAKEQATVRGADHQAPGGDRLRKGSARARAVEAQPRHQDEAGRREDGGWSAPTSAGRRTNLKMIQEVINGFTIMAPSSGMVIYVREWNGKKKGVGSQWQPWDPTVATLPDLSQMESQTYINEVDVRKIVGRPEGRDLARRRSDEEARRNGDGGLPTSVSSARTRTRRCSR